MQPVSLFIGKVSTFEVIKKDFSHSMAKKEAKMFRKSFNKNHPEVKEGEVFLTNADIEGLCHIGWKSKRKGSVAYDIHNKPIPSFGHDFFPVFVQRSELEAGGIDPDHLWSDKKKPSFLSIALWVVAVIVVLVIIITLLPK